MILDENYDYKKLVDKFRIAQRVFPGFTLYGYTKAPFDLRPSDLEQAADAIETLSVMNNTNRTGTWILHKRGGATCSLCHYWQNAIWDQDHWQNYCGMCGARMTKCKNDDR